MASGGSLSDCWCTVKDLATRPYLNGTEVFSTTFDEVKQRYNCRLSDGAMLALKPINLERCEIQKAKPPPEIRCQMRA